MGSQKEAVLVAAAFFVVAFLILYHQQLTFGQWFQVEDLHHETFALTSLALGVGVLVGVAITRIEQAKRNA